MTREERNDAVIQAFEVLREKVDALPRSRAASVCLTNLDTAYLWAAQAIVVEDEAPERELDTNAGG